MTPTPASCVTCSDEAVVVEVVSLEGGDALVRDVEGREERVAVDLIEAVAPGDRLLCHAGIALERFEGAS
jgi:hydrogenase maturation factor